MRTALLLCLVCSAAFAADRVSKARENKTETLKALFKEKQLPFPPEELYLRAFKQEKLLEVWSGPKGKPLTLVKAYPICAASGELGPKRKEGDLQVPEGFYEIKSFNPTSNFHLSMEVSYPNRSDRVLSDKEHPGGAIYVHGNCASIGCIAIQDDPIEEVYLMALDAEVRPVHIDIFPRRLDDDGLKAYEGDPSFDFWKQLAPGFAAFEKNHRPPSVKIDAKTGAYAVAPPH
ncbi:MAG: L,D-transpeptidase family protein [Myxococcaceae bacterium]